MFHVCTAARDRASRSDAPAVSAEDGAVPGGRLPLRIFEQRYIADGEDAASRTSGRSALCLITQGEEVATAGSAAPEFADRRHARDGFAAWDMPQLGILHVTRRSAATRFAGAAHTRCMPDGLVVADVTPIAPEPPVRAARATFAPLAKLLELLADARRPAALSRAIAPSTTRPGSATGSPSSCRCRCRSSRACSRSTTPTRDSWLLQQFLAQQGLV